MVEYTSENLGAEGEGSVLSWSKVSIWMTILLLVNYYGSYNYISNIPHASKYPGLMSIFFFFTVLTVFYLIGLIISLIVWRRLPRAKGLLIALSIFFVIHVAFLTAFDSNRQKDRIYPSPENIANTKRHDTQIINHESIGNLQSKHNVGCVSISSAKNEFTPADLLNGVADCIDKKQIKSAVYLYALAHAYGTFDTSRVSDRTAHQALSILQGMFIQKISKADFTTFSQELRRINLNNDEIAEICKQTRQLGPPKYRPDYMIQHGMGAFTGNQSNGGIVVDFETNKNWEEALSLSLRCPKIL